MEKESKSPIGKPLLAFAVLFLAIGAAVQYHNITEAKPKIVLQIQNGMYDNVNCHAAPEVPRLYECEVKLVFLLSDLKDPPPVPTPPPISASPTKTQISFKF